MLRILFLAVVIVFISDMSMMLAGVFEMYINIFSNRDLPEATWSLSKVWFFFEIAVINYKIMIVGATAVCVDNQQRKLQNICKTIENDNTMLLKLLKAMKSKKGEDK